MFMKQLMSITANLEQPGILRNVIEKLASRHVDMGFTNALVPSQWNAIETSGIQATVSGTIDVQKNDNSGKEVNIPFDSCFLFTCIKGKNDFFNVEWSSSLS
jgi:hypothetical protein